MQSFWNEERNLYEIRDSHNGRIVAEIADTKTMMRLLSHNAEVNNLRETYLQRERGLREFVVAYKPIEEGK